MSIIENNPLGKLVIFTPAIHIWSGAVKVARESDLANVKADLPPTTLVSDGRKTLINLDYLIPFHTARKKIHRLLSKYGFQLTPNAHAIPETLADAVATEIEEIAAEFDSHVPGFLANLDRYYDEHVANNVLWEDLLKSNRPDVDKVRQRLVFKVGAYRIAPPDESNPESRVSKQFGEAIGAVPALLDDIADNAAVLLKGPLSTGKRISQSHANSLRGMVGKLKSFGFLDHRVGPAADALSSMLDVVPLTGPISPGNAAILITIASILNDPRQVLKQAELLGDDEDDDETVDLRTVTTVSPPVPAPLPAIAGF